MSKVLTLKVADKLATSAIQKCISKKFAPITVVVLDAAGHTVVSKRMDGCSPVGYTQFAHAKANTALITKGSFLTVFLHPILSSLRIPPSSCPIICFLTNLPSPIHPFYQEQVEPFVTNIPQKVSRPSTVK